jgi:hypothetical protein
VVEPSRVLCARSSRRCIKAVNKLFTLGALYQARDCCRTGFQQVEGGRHSPTVSHVMLDRATRTKSDNFVLPHAGGDHVSTFST